MTEVRWEMKQCVSCDSITIHKDDACQRCRWAHDQEDELREAHPEVHEEYDEPDSEGDRDF